MWIQFTLSRDDLARALNTMLPLRIQLSPGTADSGVIYLGKARHVSLVPQRGLRIRVRGNIRWPVLGVKVPVTLREVQMLLEPRIVGRGPRQRLVFLPMVEEADVAMVPGFLEHWLIPKLNEQLARPESELAWNFKKTLHQDFDAPAQLSPVNRMGLRANWAAIRVNDEAMTLAMSLRFKAERANVPALDADVTEESADNEEMRDSLAPISLPTRGESAQLAPEPPLVPVASRPGPLPEEVSMETVIDDDELIESPTSVRVASLAPPPPTPEPAAPPSAQPSPAIEGSVSEPTNEPPAPADSGTQRAATPSRVA